MSEAQKPLIKLVILESPYAGDIEGNLRYAREAALDCCLRGESPQASHLLFTQFLDDNIPAQRDMGISLGLAWKRVADYSVFYTDKGWSTGMLRALDASWFSRKKIMIRSLDRPEPIMPLIHNQEQWNWTYLSVDLSKAQEGKI